MSDQNRRVSDQTPHDADEVEAWMADQSRQSHASRRRKDRRERVIFAIVVAALMIFAWRLEVAQDRINETAQMDRVHAFQQCQLINDNAKALNGLIDKVILRIQTSPGLSAKDKDEAVALYTSSKQSLPVCRKP